MKNFSYQILLKDLLYCFLGIIFLFSDHAKADDEKFDWMNSSLNNVGSVVSGDPSGCLNVPDFDNFKQNKIFLNLQQQGVWQSTGSKVTKDKAIKFDWSIRGITASPRKYRVIYRIDPRFDKPQIFIKTFNYLTNNYEATDFPKFLSTDDPTKDPASLAFGKMQDYVDYFNFAKDRQKIRIERGDVVNITLTGAGDFFGVNKDEDFLKNELDYNFLAIPSLYTNSNIDNQIIYSTAEKLCDSIDPTRTSICIGNGINTKYKTTDNLILVGKPLNTSMIQNMVDKNIEICPNYADGKDNSPVCFYDQGRGMRISVNSQIIKKESDSFVNSPLLNKSFLYYKSDISGSLNFSTDWSIQKMFTSLDKPLMSNWISNFSTLNELNSYISSSLVDLSANFLHFGRYIMIIEVGNGDSTISTEQQKDIEVEYIIIADSIGSPSSSATGSRISQDFTTDAYQDGYLWVRVKNPNKEVSGTIQVNYANYTGETKFSDIVYKGAVKPITDEFHKFTMDFYTKLAGNATLGRIAKVALILYVVIYALTFLAGATQITAKDLIIRLIKITLIVILIGPNSWDFFNDYLFKAFIEGTDYLMTNIIGVTSSKGNIFGFIDPIFDKYTNGRFWLLIFIELLQIHNGLTFVAIVTIYSLILYFRAILEVIIGYIIAYVGLSVMLALAPFFIILMLFEQTKSIFDNWLSTLFSYMIQPTILLIFFLLIDQVMSTQLSKIVVRACWGELIPIALGLDLTNMGMPQVNFSVTLPFLPAIPFFVPDVQNPTTIDDLLNSTGTFLVIFTSTLIFYAYCKMANGLVDYITIISSRLTNVAPARQEGDYQAPANPTDSIMKDIKDVTAPFKDAPIAFAKSIKDKTIDQNYGAKKTDDSGKEYTGKIFASRNDSDGENSKIDDK